MHNVIFAPKQFVEYLVVKEKYNRYEDIIIKEKENKCYKSYYKPNRRD